MYGPHKSKTLSRVEVVRIHQAAFDVYGGVNEPPSSKALNGITNLKDLAISHGKAFFMTGKRFDTCLKTGDSCFIPPSLSRWLRRQCMMVRSTWLPCVLTVVVLSS